MRRAVAAGSGLALTMGLAGCSSLASDATQAGGTPPPVVLTIGSDDPPGRPASNQMKEFADRVRDLSDGALRIELSHQAAGVGIDDWDQAVARLVVSGELDLGLIPARSWDTEGVTTLRATIAPLLITTDEHLDAVARDDELSGDLLAGLDEVGVTGLALVPEGIRYLVSTGGDGVVESLTAGGQVRSPWSETTWSFFEALGARPTDAEFTPEMAAAESELALAGTLGAADTVTGNLPLFPKLNSLVANTGAFEELDGEQQEWLREAAAATRDWAIYSRDHDVDLAVDFCTRGGTVVHEPQADSADVQGAAAAVTTELRGDDRTAGLIDRIADLDLGEDTPVHVCSPADVPVTTDSITPDGGDLPDGVYRVEFTDRYLEDQGLSTDMVAINHGTWTITMEDGRWQVEQVTPAGTETFGGVYQVREDRLYWYFTDEQMLFSVAWSLADDGSLRFGRVDGAKDGHFHWGLPWRRVGDTGPQEPATDDVTAATIRPEGGDLPDGTYRIRFTDRYLADHGLPPDNIADNHGVWTTVLDDGQWSIDQVASDITDHFEGVYEVRGRDLWWRFHDVPEVLHLRWSVTGEGDLVFEEIPELETPDFQFDLPWERVD